MPGRRVLVIGDVLIDELRTADGSEEFPGGSALNVAVGLARLGVDATLAGVLAPDAAVIRRHLEDAGVAIIPSPAPHGTPRAVSDRTDGEPVYHFTEAAVRRRVDFGAELRSRMASAALVAVSGFPFDDRPQLDELLDAVADQPLAIDANPRSGLILDRERFAAGYLEAAASARLVKIGVEDAELVFGETVETAARRFLDAGAERVLVTRGAGGAALWDGAGQMAVPIVDAAGLIVDTMGAGDATFSAIIASMVAPGDTDWRGALEHAMAIAAATIREPGGMLRTPVAG
jgi:fructokinase